MKLAVFDLDGTLTQTSHVDAECYEQALREIAGIRDVRTDWSTYEHATDTGIIDEIYRERFGRSPTDEECDVVQARLIELFHARCAREDSEFGEVPGAGNFLRNLLEKGWMTSLATGAWRCSAEFKISRSGLPIADLPIAVAEDGPSREAILCAAIERARERYEVQGFDRVVAVGDGVWDIRAAAASRLPFVGVAQEPGAGELHAQGASHVLEDYLDHERWLRALEEARIPIKPAEAL